MKTEPKDILQQIADEPEFNGSPADNAELAAALGGQVEIAGQAFPAPAAAVIALLDAIESPFVCGGKAEAATLDVFRALYVIGQREKTALPVLRLMRRKAAIAAMSGDADGGEAAMGGVMAASLRQAVADAEAEFDAAAVAFCSGLGCFSPVDAAREIGDYLAMATGWSMIPAGESKKNSASALTS